MLALGRSSDITPPRGIGSSTWLDPSHLVANINRMEVTPREEAGRAEISLSQHRRGNEDIGASRSGRPDVTCPRASVLWQAVDHGRNLSLESLSCLGG